MENEKYILTNSISEKTTLTTLPDALYTVQNKIMLNISRYINIDIKNLRLYPYCKRELMTLEELNNYIKDHGTNTEKYKYVFIDRYGNFGYLLSENVIESLETEIKEIEETLIKYNNPTLNNIIIKTIDEYIQDITNTDEINKQIKTMLLDFKNKIQSIIR